MRPRYRVYREHKFVDYVLSEYCRLTAKTDFRRNDQVQTLLSQLGVVVDLMKGHAEHEDKTIHQLLRNKNSTVHLKIEEEHGRHEALFSRLEQQLHAIFSSSNNDTRVALGYQFYLQYRCFMGDNLAHLHEEETVIMPELQRLYSDQELREQIDAKSYEHMTVEQLVHMVAVLFPHFNPDDRSAFLLDIRDAQPEKFAVAWREIVKMPELFNEGEIDDPLPHRITPDLAEQST